MLILNHPPVVAKMLLDKNVSECNSERVKGVCRVSFYHPRVKNSLDRGEVIPGTVKAMPNDLSRHSVGVDQLPCNAIHIRIGRCFYLLLHVKPGRCV